MNVSLNNVSFNFEEYRVIRILLQQAIAGEDYSDSFLEQVKDILEYKFSKSSIEFNDNNAFEGLNNKISDTNKHVLELAVRINNLESFNKRLLMKLDYYDGKFASESEDGIKIEDLQECYSRLYDRIEQFEKQIEQLSLLCPGVYKKDDEITTDKIRKAREQSRISNE